MTTQGLLFALLAIPVTLLVLCVLVLAHEFGHFITARLSGIKVLEFGIGFPPRAKVLHDDGETLYTLNYLPIGGFCRFEGEDSDSDDPRSFSMAGLPKQILVLVAGVTMNLLMAFAIFFVVAWVWSPGETVKAEYVLPNSAAGRAGLPNGIQIESLNGERFHFLVGGDPLEAIKAHPGETVTIGYIDSSGARKTAVVELGSTTNPNTGKVQGFLGITCQSPAMMVVGAVQSGMNWGRLATAQPQLPPQTCSMTANVNYAVLQTDPGAAAATAFDQTTKSLGLILGALGDLGAHIATEPTQAPPGVMGPAGITQSVGLVLLDYGPVMLLILAAILSANLALINILPIPPFDGGKIAIQGIKRVFGVRGVTNYEIVTNLVGFVLLFVFLGWITYFDILRLGGG